MIRISHNLCHNSAACEFVFISPGYISYCHARDLVRQRNVGFCHYNCAYRRTASIPPVTPRCVTYNLHVIFKIPLLIRESLAMLKNNWQPLTQFAGDNHQWSLLVLCASVMSARTCRASARRQRGQPGATRRPLTPFPRRQVPAELCPAHHNTLRPWRTSFDTDLVHLNVESTSAVTTGSLPRQLVTLNRRAWRQPCVIL